MAESHPLDAPRALGFFYELSMLAFESQQAILLRVIKLSVGGADAATEAELMVSEKIGAAQAAIVNLLGGTLPVGIVSKYRSAVQANVARLKPCN